MIILIVVEVAFLNIRAKMTSKKYGDNRRLEK